MTRAQPEQACSLGIGVQEAREPPPLGPRRRLRWGSSPAAYLRRA